MKKIVLLFIALSVAITLIIPDLDIYAYFMNLLENFPPLQNVISTFVEQWEEVGIVFDKISLHGLNWENFGEAFGSIMSLIFEGLFGIAYRLIKWFVEAVVVLFGGAL